MQWSVLIVGILAASPVSVAWTQGSSGAKHTTPVTQTLTEDVCRVQSSSFLDVEIQEGAQPEATLMVDASLKDAVSLVVSGDTLTVNVRSPIRYPATGRVLVVLKEFCELTLQGSGNAKIAATARAIPRRLTVQGSGDLEAEIIASSVEASIRGSGDLSMKGSAESLSASSNGSGNVRFSGKADMITLSLRGSGGANLVGKTETLNVSLRGSGDLDATRLPARNAVVETRGSGDVLLNLDGGTLRARSFGSGDVRWTGEATVAEAERRGSGTIARR